METGFSEICVRTFLRRVFTGEPPHVCSKGASETFKEIVSQATITALAVDALKVVSGSADTKVLLWDRVSGVKLRVLHGHAKAVLCLHVGPTWMVQGAAPESDSIDVSILRCEHFETCVVVGRVSNTDRFCVPWLFQDTRRVQSPESSNTGSVQYEFNDVQVSGGAESEARVWQFPAEADPSTATGTQRHKARAVEALTRGHVHCRKVLLAGDGFDAGPGLTAVKYGALEVIAGLADGSVVVWWLATGEVQQRVKAHASPVGTPRLSKRE